MYALSSPRSSAESDIQYVSLDDDDDDEEEEVTVDSQADADSATLICPQCASQIPLASRFNIEGQADVTASFTDDCPIFLPAVPEDRVTTSSDQMDSPVKESLAAEGTLEQVLQRCIESAPPRIGRRVIRAASCPLRTIPDVATGTSTRVDGDNSPQTSLNQPIASAPIKAHNADHPCSSHDATVSTLEPLGKSPSGSSVYPIPRAAALPANLEYQSSVDNNDPICLPSPLKPDEPIRQFCSDARGVPAIGSREADWPASATSCIICKHLRQANLQLEYDLKEALQQVANRISELGEARKERWRLETVIRQLEAFKRDAKHLTRSLREDSQLADAVNELAKPAQGMLSTGISETRRSTGGEGYSQIREGMDKSVQTTDQTVGSRLSNVDANAAGHDQKDAVPTACISDLNPRPFTDVHLSPLDLLAECGPAKAAGIDLLLKIAYSSKPSTGLRDLPETGQALTFAGLLTIIPAQCTEISEASKPRSLRVRLTGIGTHTNLDQALLDTVLPATTAIATSSYAFDPSTQQREMSLPLIRKTEIIRQELATQISGIDNLSGKNPPITFNTVLPQHEVYIKLKTASDPSRVWQTEREKLLRALVEAKVFRLTPLQCTAFDANQSTTTTDLEADEEQLAIDTQAELDRIKSEPHRRRSLSGFENRQRFLSSRGGLDLGAMKIACDGLATYACQPINEASLEETSRPAPRISDTDHRGEMMVDGAQVPFPARAKIVFTKPLFSWDPCSGVASVDREVETGLGSSGGGIGASGDGISGHMDAQDLLGDAECSWHQQIRLPIFQPRGAAILPLAQVGLILGYFRIDGLPAAFVVDIGDRGIRVYPPRKFGSPQIAILDEVFGTLLRLQEETQDALDGEAGGDGSQHRGQRSPWTVDLSRPVSF